jgi:hypothetical protein
MPFVNMQDLLIHAREHGYAVAALDEVSLGFLEGVIRAAENCRAPAIVSLAKSHFEHYICSWPPRRRLAAALARRSPSISTGIPRRAACGYEAGAHGRRALPLLLAHPFLLRTGDRCLPEPSRQFIGIAARPDGVFLI